MSMQKSVFSKKFGEQLKKEKEKLSISQSELARMCLKDRQYIHRIENGTITPTIYTVFLICKELNINIAALMPKEPL
ncbi:MAG TPA: helix-turn-helix transcriptional regulator [Chitinophagaceae bacterium]|nr:helix-turn-helix transcriptional regulator [Chitinophagaceae bacterium]HQV05620.1 helix-turn-helix transcriptional regulator [Chitinophagaceae bacterium]